MREHWWRITLTDIATTSAFAWAIILAGPAVIGFLAHQGAARWPASYRAIVYIWITIWAIYLVATTRYLRLVYNYDSGLLEILGSVAVSLIFLVPFAKKYRD